MFLPDLLLLTLGLDVYLGTDFFLILIAPEWSLNGLLDAQDVGSRLYIRKLLLWPAATDHFYFVFIFSEVKL